MFRSSIARRTIRYPRPSLHNPSRRKRFHQAIPALKRTPPRAHRNSAIQSHHKLKLRETRKTAVQRHRTLTPPIQGDHHRTANGRRNTNGQNVPSLEAKGKTIQEKLHREMGDMRHQAKSRLDARSRTHRLVAARRLFTRISRPIQQRTAIRSTTYHQSHVGHDELNDKSQIDHELL